MRSTLKTTSYLQTIILSFMTVATMLVSVNPASAVVVEKITAKTYKQEVLDSKIPVFVLVLPEDEDTDESSASDGGPPAGYWSEKAVYTLERAFGLNLDRVKFVVLDANHDPDLAKELNSSVSPEDLKRPLLHFMVNGKAETSASGCPCNVSFWFPRNIDLYVSIVLENLKAEQNLQKK